MDLLRDRGCGVYIGLQEVVMRRKHVPLTQQFPLPAKAAAFFDAEEWAAWRYGSWDEQRVGEAIMTRVATRDERQQMFDANIDYATMVNGRVEGNAKQQLTDQLLAAWNERLGYEVFFK